MRLMKHDVNLGRAGGRASTLAVSLLLSPCEFELLTV